MSEIIQNILAVLPGDAGTQVLEGVLFVGIIVSTMLTATVFRRLFTRYIQRSVFIINNDATNYKFLKHAITALIYVVGISWAIYRIEAFRTIASSMLAGAGILAVAVGFASQQALSNIVSGILIVIYKPFRVNDRITLTNGLMGVVEDLTLRHTVIRDFENRRIIIPNSVMSSETITNATIADERILKMIEFGISYNSDIDSAKQIIIEEAMKHPMRIDGRTEQDIANEVPEVPIRLTTLADSAVILKVWVWCKNPPDAFTLSCELLESVKKRFDVEGIEIPYPHRTVYMRHENNDA